MIKYSLSQYAHDINRLKYIELEMNELRRHGRAWEWLQERVNELLQERLILEERMFRYERQPQNMPK